MDRTRALLIALAALGAAAALWLAAGRGDPAADPGVAADVEAERRARALELVKALGYVDPAEREPEPTGPHRVHGVVRDAESRPVPGVEVKLKMEGTGAPRVFRTVRSDDEGRYSIEDLPAGRIVVGLGQFTTLREPWALATELAGDVEHDLVKPGALRLSGFVEAPLGGEVLLQLHELGAFPPTAIAREGSGRFAFAGLLPGRHRLLVTSDRHGTIEREVELAETTAGYDLALEPAAVLAGRLEPQYEHDGFQVRYELVEEATGRSRLGWLEVDEPFAFDHLAPGLYVLRLEHAADGDARYLRHRCAYRLAAAADTDGLVLAIPEGRELDVVLRPGAPRPESEGEVELVDGRGLVVTSLAMRLAADGDGGVTLQHLADEGNFGILAVDVHAARLHLVPDGRYRVRARFEGYAPAEREVEVRGDTAVELALEPLPGRMVAFHVPDDYLRVDVRPAGGDRWEPWLEWDYRTRGASHARPTGALEAFLPTGAHDLRVMPAQHVETVLAGVEIADSGELLRLAPEPAPGLAIRGGLRDRLGRPLAATVHVLRRSGLEWTPVPGRVRPYESAAFEFLGLEPGAYRLALDPEGKNVLDDVVLDDRDLRLELTY